MWHVTSDVEIYADHVWDLLAGDPEASTVGLTIIESLRSGFRFGDIPPSMGWFEMPDGSVTGAFQITPPWPLLINALPEGSTDALVEALRAHSVPVREVHAAEAVATCFAEAWTEGTALESEETMRMRLYRLGELVPPAGTPGEGRVAVETDLDLIVEWSDAFEEEAGGHAENHEQYAREAIAGGTMTLWTVPSSGEVVSMAGRRPAAAGVARIGPVYTPPQMRRRGFGAAATAVATQAALDAGAESVVLFTDLSNLTSNSIYQAIGYRPVSDRRVVRFVGPD